MQICILGLVDPYVVNLFKLVELLLKLDKFLVRNDSGGLQIDELRMQRKSRVGVVRIRIHPLAGHRRIVDRQNLNHALTRCCRPVNQLREIQEFSHAEVVPGAQCKDRNCSAGALPARNVRPAVGDFPGSAATQAVRTPLVTGRDAVRTYFVIIFDIVFVSEQFVLIDFCRPQFACFVFHCPRAFS